MEQPRDKIVLKSLFGGGGAQRLVMHEMISRSNITHSPLSNPFQTFLAQKHRQEENHQHVRFGRPSAFISQKGIMGSMTIAAASHSRLDGLSDLA